MAKQTTFKLNLATMVLASAVMIVPATAWAQSAAKVSQTNLVKVAATIDKVNQLMRQTINQTIEHRVKAKDMAYSAHPYTKAQPNAQPLQKSPRRNKHRCRV